MKAIMKPTALLDGEIQALLLKNYTTRYILISALKEGTSTVYYPAHSEDSDALRRCIRDLGAIVDEDETKMTICGFGNKPRPVNELNVGNAGAVLRFLMLVAAFCPELTFVNTYPDSLGKRPHDDLIDAPGNLACRSSITAANCRSRFVGKPRGGKISGPATSAHSISAPCCLRPRCWLRIVKSRCCTT